MKTILIYMKNLVAVKDDLITIGRQSLFKRSVNCAGNVWYKSPGEHRGRAHPLCTKVVKAFLCSPDPIIKLGEVKGAF